MFDHHRFFLEREKDETHYNLIRDVEKVNRIYSKLCAYSIYAS
jgi:hypothetical protein